MPVPVPEGYQSAFAVPCYTGLQTSLCARLDIEWWLAITDIDLATFCRIFTTVGPQLGPKASKVNVDKWEPPTHHLHASMLVIVVKKISKMVGNHLLSIEDLAH